MHSKIVAIFFLALLISSCGDKSKLTSDEISYVRLTSSLVKAKSSAPPTADSVWLKYKLDSIMRSYHTDQKSYVAATTALSSDPEHTVIIYHAIKDTLGLK